MFSKFSAFITLTLITGLVVAGPKVTGNGGDGVVCRNSDGSIRSVVLLDYYEEVELRSNPLSLSPALTVEQNFSQIVSRMDAYNSQQLLKQFATFVSEARFLSGIDLVDIPDSDHIVVPRNCKVEQMAIQTTPTDASPKRYTINKDLWDKLDTVGQAGLIAHELFYRTLLTNNYREDLDSVPVRYLNGILASNTFRKLSFKKSIEALVASGFQYSQQGPFLARNSQIVFNEKDENKVKGLNVFLLADGVFEFSKHFSLTFERTKNRNIELSLVVENDIEHIRSIQVESQFLEKQSFLSADYELTPAVDPNSRFEFELNAAGKLISLKGPVELYLKAAAIKANCFEVSIGSELNAECRAGYENRLEIAFVVKPGGTFNHVLFGSDKGKRYVTYQREYASSGKLKKLTYFRHTNPALHSEQDFSMLPSNYFAAYNADGSPSAQNISSKVTRFTIKEGDSLFFSDDNYIRGGNPTDSVVSEFPRYSDFLIYTSPKHPLEFHSNGNLKSATIILKKDENDDSIPVTFEDLKGNFVKLGSYTLIELDSAGKLVRWTPNNR